MTDELRPWTLPSEWREWARKAAETDARVHGFGLALHRRIRELDRDSGACFAALGTLARMIGCCERTVRRWLRKLEAWGYVLRLDREWKSGMRRSHVLVPVAPVGASGDRALDLTARCDLLRRAWDHANRCAASWLPSRGLRAPLQGPLQMLEVSSPDTGRTKTWVNAWDGDESADLVRLFDGWGTASGPGPGDPGWREPERRAA